MSRILDIGRRSAKTAAAMLPLWLVLSASIAASPLPEHILLKTSTQSFGAIYDVALRDGRVWWRRQPTGPWLLLPPDGLPAPRGRLEALKEAAQVLPLAPTPFHRPERLVSLTADGDNLVVVGEDGRIYYTKLSTLDWTDTWGPAPLAGPLLVPARYRGLAMSHRKIAYEDLDGNPHPVSAGVTTLYLLNEDGTSLAYADPWLPPKFDHRLCLPLRGRFIAEAVAASASTVFVMDASGRSFTRLADFDTLGHNPALPYSYAREKRRGPTSAVRTLPGEDWREQPRIPGPHSTHLTILQDGQTNAARELRVEGEGGYWTKHVFDPAWSFVSTGAPRTGPLVQPDAARLGPDHDTQWRSAAPFLGATAELRQWNPDCAPAVLHLTKGTEVVELPLQFRERLEVVPTSGRQFKGALFLPSQGAGPVFRALRGLALGRGFLEVNVSVDGAQVVLEDAALASRFRLAFTRSAP